ncbi:hypothetical protein [uncultured Roseobacter sp.]|uniref:hypothetical protein n=1 Tax=uncultured Roseobacter sp. TaxID=114847 RepID=UPI0026194663|nr:hypothetical protein [uncultured Roseobacter sp.]
MKDRESERLDHLDVGTREMLLKQVEKLGEMIQRDRLSAPVVDQIASLAKLLPGLINRQGTDMCDKGDGAQAEQWEVQLNGVTFITCSHNPPHIRLK